jgi:hypothetical protein
MKTHISLKNSIKTTEINKEGRIVMIEMIDQEIKKERMKRNKGQLNQKNNKNQNKKKDEH